MAITFIKKEDINQLDLLPLGRKRHPVRAAIGTLEVGQVLLITRDEFRMKHRTPNFFCRDIEKKTGKKFVMSRHRVSRDWVVERVG